MKINYYHKLDLKKSTQIEFIHPKPKKRKQQDDKYDFDDALIEHMENEDELVAIESNLENFFVYKGTLTEHSQAVLKKYDQRLKKTANKKMLKTNNTQTLLSENFSIKILNFYNDTKTLLMEQLQKYPDKPENLHLFAEDETASPDGQNEKKISNIVEELVILEACYTDKKLQDISADIVLANGPMVTSEDLVKIIKRNQEKMESEASKFCKILAEAIENNVRDNNGHLKLHKENLLLGCEVIDRKIKNHFLRALESQTPCKKHRKVKKDCIQELIGDLNDLDFENLKKQITKIDFQKMPKNE